MFKILFKIFFQFLKFIFKYSLVFQKLESYEFFLLLKGNILFFFS